MATLKIFQGICQKVAGNGMNLLKIYGIYSIQKHIPK